MYTQMHENYRFVENIANIGKTWQENWKIRMQINCIDLALTDFKTDWLYGMYYIHDSLRVELHTWNLLSAVNEWANEWMARCWLDPQKVFLLMGVNSIKDSHTSVYAGDWIVDPRRAGAHNFMSPPLFLSLVFNPNQ